MHSSGVLEIAQFVGKRRLVDATFFGFRAGFDVGADPVIIADDDG